MDASSNAATFTIDGAAFDDIAGFYAHLNDVFMRGEDWRLGVSLDALNDMLHGGYGALNGAAHPSIRWLRADKSRADLGYAETRQWLIAKLATPRQFNERMIRAQLDALDAGTGPTYFDLILQVFADHPDVELALFPDSAP